MKALLWFWAAVLVLLAAGAAVLQVMGPLPAPPHAAPAPPHPVTAPNKDLQAPPKPVASLPPPSLLEPAPELPGRMLPRIGPHGLAPAAAYAMPAPETAGKFRIALVLDGIGLDAALSERAVRELPRAVTMAFSAYTPDSDADRLGWDARVAGHECLVSIPMEPAGRPFADEGTRALLTGADAKANEDNLHWALSREGGCVGATGASDGGAGERFAGSGPEFDDMLREIRGRGLLYLDPRAHAALPDDPGVRSADLVVDKTEDAGAPVTARLIEDRLAALEAVAREKGSAIGLAGPPLPVLTNAIAGWGRGLAARGFVLVPISNLMPLAASRK